MENTHWQVFYTKPRNEKKVFERLLTAGIDIYLPLQSRLKVWSDRKKKVDEPLFRGYIFARGTDAEMEEVLKDFGVVRRIYHAGKPAIIRDVEIQGIKKFLESGIHFERNDYIQVGDKVRIVEGPLNGILGEVLSSTNETTFILNLTSINASLQVKIQNSMLEKL